MRTIPGMTILNPADDVEAKAAVEAAIRYEGPVYLRFGRLAAPIFNDPATYQFTIGKGITLREGSDLTLVATGLMVSESLKAAELLEAEGIHARVLNIHTIKPLDEELICQAASETGLLVTVEEGQRNRRSGRRCGRSCDILLSGTGGSHWCQRRIRLLRSGSRTAEEVRFVRRQHCRSGKESICREEVIVPYNPYQCEKQAFLIILNACFF